MFELFVSFGMVWWLLVIAASACIIWAIHYSEDSWTGCVWTTMLTILVMFVLGDLVYMGGETAFAWMPGAGKILVFGVLYFVIGSLWSLFKWWKFGRFKFEKYEDFKTEWLMEHGINSKHVPDHLKSEFHEFILKHKSEFTRYIHKYDETAKCTTSVKIVDPRIYPREHKSLISLWITWWPWSAFWYFTADFIQSISRRITRSLIKIMDQITAMTFKGIEADWSSKHDVMENKDGKNESN